MKTNEIRIEVKVPRTKAFEFVIEPNNTPLWIDSAEKKSIDTEQINIGTKYINNYGTLEVTDYEKDVFFELTNAKNGYQCSYSFRKINEESTEMVYFEAMFDGSELAEPMEQRHFEKLKLLLES